MLAEAHGQAQSDLGFHVREAHFDQCAGTVPVSGSTRKRLFYLHTQACVANNHLCLVMPRLKGQVEAKINAINHSVDKIQTAYTDGLVNGFSRVLGSQRLLYK